jgi:hypothetical protein
MSKTGDEVQNESLAFDNDLDFDADNVEIEEGDCQGTVVAYPPVTDQGCLNGCGSAKAG